MIKSSLIHYIQSFSLKEMKRFHLFVQSPYFCKNAGVQALVAYLADLYPHFDAENVNRQLVFQKVYGKTPYNEGKLKNLFSQCLKLVEQFWITEKILADEAAQHNALLQNIRERNLSKRFEKYFKSTPKTDYQNSQALYQKYQHCKEGDLFYIYQNNYQYNHLLEAQDQYLTHFYVSEKLRIACEMRNRQKILNLAFDFTETTSLIEHIGQDLTAYQNVPSVLIYRQIYLSLTEPQHSQHYFDLMELLDVHAARFPTDERRVLYFYGLNYCIGQINLGQKAFLQEMFLLFQKLLEKDLLLENGVLAEWHYKNIVTIALRLQAFEWVEHFIHEYKDNLSPTIVTNAYSYCLANFYYHTQEYAKALQLLNSVQYSTIIYNLDAKTLLLKIYYETDEEMALRSLIESFKHYLMRNKLIAKPKYIRYHNLFKLSLKSYKLKQIAKTLSKNKLTEEKEKLQNKIEEQKITNVEWLKSKLEEIS